MNARNAAVYLTLAAGVLVLGRYTLNLYIEDLRDWRRVEVLFEDVGGLRVKDAVRLHGARVGRVAGIRLHEDKQLVTLEVLPEVALRADARVKIVSTNALGFVNVELDEGSATVAPLTTGRLAGTVYVGVGQAPSASGRRSIHEGLDSFEAGTRALLDPDSGVAGGLLADPRRVSSAREALHDLRTSWAGTDAGLATIEAGQGLGKGLDPVALGALANTVASLRDTLSRLRDGLRGVARGEGTTGRLMGDPVQGQVLAEALDGWAGTLSGVRRGEGLAGRLSDPASGLSTQLRATVDDLATVTGEARHGRGLLGALSSPEHDAPTRDLLRGLPRGLQRLRGSGLVHDPRAGERAQDALGSVDDAVVNLRRGLEGLRRDLGARATFQGAVFAVF